MNSLDFFQGERSRCGSQAPCVGDGRACGRSIHSDARRAGKMLNDCAPRFPHAVRVAASPM